MTIQAVAQTIQLIIAPVVMVTTCGIILTGFLARYAAINDRLRLMVRERLDLLRPNPELPGQSARYAAALDRERLAQIDAQVPELLRRHRLLRDAIFLLYLAIAVFIASMLGIAAAAVSGLAWLATAALVSFLTGTLVLLASVLLTALELRASHRALEFEVRRVTALPENPK
jgi:hypothetical protein